MEPSSGQNSSKNGNPSEAQTSADETHKNDDSAASEETPEKKRAPEDTESNASSSEASHSQVNTAEEKLTNSEATSTEPSTASEKIVTKGRKKLPVVLTYAARDRPRQPFFGGTPVPQAGRSGHVRNIPPPPSYYPNRAAVPAVTTAQPTTTRPPATTTTTAATTRPIQQQPSNDSRRTEHQYTLPGDIDPLTNPMVNPFTNVVMWAPYPSKISANVPSYLAQLIDAEVLFVVQHMEIFEYFGNIDLPNIYLVQNKNGETIYYVYESTVCIPCCCKNSRSLQLHVMDMYQNEVIYMNKTCGCGLYFCCFPVLEVYSPPTVPIGAIIKKCHPFQEQFNIVDADENLLFRVHGDCSLMYCSKCLQYDFIIRSLDGRETEVGFIRRDFPGMYQFMMGTEYFGVSFPGNMDVRMKAVFLGALFLIDFLYFE